MSADNTDLNREFKLNRELTKVESQYKDVFENLDNEEEETDDFDIEAARAHVQKLRTIIKQTRDERWDALDKCSRYRRRFRTMAANIKESNDQIKSLKYAHTKLKSDAQNQNKLFTTEFKNIVRSVKNVFHELSTREKCDGTCGPLRKSYKALVEELKETRAQHSALVFEKKKLSHQLEIRTQEFDELTEKVRNRELAEGGKQTKVNRELVQKEVDLKNAMKDVNSVRRKLDQEIFARMDLEKTLKDRNDDISLLTSQLKSTEEHLKKSQLERDRLQREIGHGQIEQDKHKSQFDSSLKEHSKRMESDFNVWKEEIRVKMAQQLEIEKQKLKEELEKCVEEYRNNESKMTKQLKSLQGKQKDKHGELQKQLDEQNSAFKIREEQLLADIKQLKNVISQLQENNNAGEGSDEEDKALKIDQLERKLAKAKLKIKELEELIRKECEERLELTEALNNVKSELLMYKTPRDDYHVPKPNRRFREKDKRPDPNFASGVDLNELRRQTHQSKSLGSLSHDRLVQQDARKVRENAFGSPDSETRDKLGMDTDFTRHSRVPPLNLKKPIPNIKSSSSSAPNTSKINKTDRDFSWDTHQALPGKLSDRSLLPKPQTVSKGQFDRMAARSIEDIRKKNLGGDAGLKIYKEIKDMLKKNNGQKT